MKQFTTPEQTAKLIWLGLPKPKSIMEIITPYDGVSLLTFREAKASEVEYIRNYSIGELIEMLPRDRGGCPLMIDGNLIFEKWAVYYEGAKGFSRDELIDALYDMILKLKEEGVI